MFFDIPINELYNRNVPLKYLFRHDANKLEMKLFEAKSFSEKIQIAENYLLGLLNKGNGKYDYNRIEHCVDLINKRHGIANIDFLASEACLSRKQFERTFSSYVGTSPKQFLKTIRFQLSLHYKYLNKLATCTDLTYNCGYYDQSHMINDFQKLTGFTPKQYFDECEPYSDYFH
jgi:AraC-like DNA-binding protein